jgi:ethanolamine ammonia-lyase small subunit
MNDTTARWNIAVSSDTDRSLRMFLAAHGRSRKGDLSKFIEEAVRKQLFESFAEEARDATQSLNEQDLSEIVAEAVQWVRAG